jgi:outer membrane biosynthesis protein TonB
VARLVPPKAKPKPVARPKKAETPKAKPKPAKAEPKQKAKPKKKIEPEQKKVPPSAFESVLKTVEQLNAQPSKTAEKPKEKRAEPALESQVAKALSKSAEPYDSGLPVTMSEIEAVRRQIERCWNLPAGAKDAENLIVSIRVEMNIDGTPRTAVATDQGRMRSDPFYRAAAESAVRAVLNPRCHPFTLPREKFKRWQTMTLVFNPKEMFGT